MRKRRITGGIYDPDTLFVLQDVLSCGHVVPVPEEATGLECYGECVECPPKDAKGRADRRPEVQRGH